MCMKTYMTSLYNHYVNVVITYTHIFNYTSVSLIVLHAEKYMINTEVYVHVHIHVHVHVHV